MTAQVHGVKIAGETVVWPFRAALFMAVRIMPGGQVILYGPFSMN